MCGREARHQRQRKKTGMRRKGKKRMEEMEREEGKNKTWRKIGEKRDELRKEKR